MSLLARFHQPLQRLYHQLLPIETRQRWRLSRYLPPSYRPLTPFVPHFAPEPDPAPLGLAPMKGKPKIGVVIPTQNQLPALQLTLGMLSWQSMTDFVVLVADDNSTDGTAEWVETMHGLPFWSNRLYHVPAGPHDSAHLSRMRNGGIGHLPASVWLAVTLDSGVILHPAALETYLKWHTTFPNALLAGMLEWLPPLELSRVQATLAADGVDGLARLVDRSVPLEQVAASGSGPEYRPRHGLTFAESPAQAEAHPVRREWLLGGNLAYPIRLHRFVGGYDEQAHGFEDADFGERLGHAGIEMVGVGAAFGLVLHQTRAPHHASTTQQTLDHLIRTYQQGGLPASVVDVYLGQVDWRYHAHYHRARGAEIVSPDGVLWAINGPRTHRLQLPNADWLATLGFAAHDVHVIAPSELAAFEVVGVAGEAAAH